jgi:hypothetical protein
MLLLRRPKEMPSKPRRAVVLELELRGAKNVTYVKQQHRHRAFVNRHLQEAQESSTAVYQHV